METDKQIVNVESRLIALRGQQVIIDRDVAELYGVETRDINKAVRNNPDKFPEGYIIALDKDEKDELVENFHRFNPLKHSTVAPHAFTEKGLYMLATILKSPMATKTTIAIIETFAKVRSLKAELLALHKEKDKDRQSEGMHRFSQLLSEIVMPDLQTSDTETTLELDFFIGKLKHPVRRVRRNDGTESEEDE